MYIAYSRSIIAASLSVDTDDTVHDVIVTVCVYFPLVVISELFNNRADPVDIELKVDPESAMIDVKSPVLVIDFYTIAILLLSAAFKLENVLLDKVMLAE